MTDGYTINAVSSLEAESAIIGSLLLDNTSIDRMGDRLRPEHFFGDQNRAIFAEITKQLGAGRVADVVTVFSAMGGLVTLADLHEFTQYIPSTANIRRYADTVIERSKSRDLMAVSSSIVELAADSTMSIDDKVESAQGQLAKLIDDTPRDEWVGAYEGMVKHSQVLEDRASGKVKAWPTGLADLDDVLEGGNRPGELVIIGARPSMGKTALALSVGLYQARELCVGMLSMEMPHSELNDRMTAMLGNVSMSSVKRPSRDAGLQWDRVIEGTEKARLLNWYASDQGGLNINQVRSKARNLKRLHGLNILIVDYIGLMSGLDQKQPRAYQLEEISRGLKTLAKELNITVLCLAQVNRKVEERVEQDPGLSDLRDSGAIEQDADVVMFINRPIQAKPELGPEWANYARLTVAKNRQGRCGKINLFYQGDQTRFTNWSGGPPTSVQQERKQYKGFQ